MKKKFRLHWLHGKTEIIEGNDITDAFNKAGYGAGALRALDYYEEVRPLTLTECVKLGIKAGKTTVDDCVANITNDNSYSKEEKAGLLHRRFNRVGLLGNESPLDFLDALNSHNSRTGKEL